MEDPILQYKILDAVQETEGNLAQSSLAKKIGRSVASVNFALRLLAVKGYIKISGANRRNLIYSITQSGIIKKSILAYNFLRNQSRLYDDVRGSILCRLKDLRSVPVNSVAVYVWTPFTESVVLFLLSEGVVVEAIYVESSESIPQAQINRVPFKLIEEFDDQVELIILLEEIPEGFIKDIACAKLTCFP